MNFFQRLLNAGVTPDTPYDLVVILRTAAITNLSLMAGALLFVVVFAAVAPAMVPVLLIGFLLMLTSMFLQYFGFHVVSRLIISVCVCAIATAVYGFVSRQAGVAMEKTFAVSTLFALAPWFLFSVREVGFSLVCVTVNLMMLMFVNDLMTMLAIPPDAATIADPLIQNVILTAGITILSGSTLSLQWMNRSEAEKGSALLEKLSRENAKSNEREQALNQAIERLQVSQQEEQRRAWATKGLAEVSRILRNIDDSQRTSDQLIAYLVKYIEANQGAIFQLLTEEGDQYFELRACYAYERKKFVDKKVDVGQGLLGQCFYERSYIHLTEVPANYVHITSGLGFATPRALIVLPLIANDEVIGAMELASFRKFEKYQIDFLMDIGEIIAMSFNNIRVSDRTKSLLQETQMMAEQMRSQDEEMRQNMEEIAATQEHQSRMEHELREQLGEKDKIIAELRLKINGKQRSVDTLVENQN